MRQYEDIPVSIRLGGSYRYQTLNSLDRRGDTDVTGDIFTGTRSLFHRIDTSYVFAVMRQADGYFVRTTITVATGGASASHIESLSGYAVAGHFEGEFLGWGVPVNVLSDELTACDHTGHWTSLSDKFISVSSMSLITTVFRGRYPGPEERPYGVRVDFEVEADRVVTADDEEQPAFLNIWDEACVLVDSERIFRFERDKSIWMTKDRNVWSVYIEGFERAAEAEIAAEQFGTALMLTSVMMGPALQLEYRGPNSGEVFSRRYPTDEGIRAFVSQRSISSRETQIRRIDLLRDNWSFAWENDLDNRLPLALELYCGAQFESTDRARFLGTVSCIEPLAVRDDYTSEAKFGADIDELVEKFLAELETYDRIPPNVANSLRGRGRNLKRQSIRQACKQLIEQRLPDYEQAVDIYDRAYGLRSKMLHDGYRPDDLGKIAFEAKDVVRSLFVSYVKDKESNVN